MEVKLDTAEIISIIIKYLEKQHKEYSFSFDGWEYEHRKKSSFLKTQNKVYLKGLSIKMNKKGTKTLPSTGGGVESNG